MSSPSSSKRVAGAANSKRYEDYEISSLRRIKNMADDLPEIIAEKAAAAALEECADALKPKRRIRTRKPAKARVFASLSCQTEFVQSALANMSKESGLMFLKGESGAGKSHVLALLVEQLLSTCTAHALLLCDPKRHRLPFSVARSLLTSLCWSNKVQPADVLKQVFSRRPHLGLFPNISTYLGVDLAGAGIPTIAVGFDLQQKMLLEIFVGWLDELVATLNPGNIVLLVDNAQFADPMWIPFVEDILKSKRPYLVSMLCAVPIQFEATQAMQEHCNARTVQLSALSPQDAQTLVNHITSELIPGVQSVSGVLFDQIFFRGGGNPLFLIEIVRVFVNNKHVECKEGMALLKQEDGGWALADSKLRDMVTVRFQQLPTPALQILQEAAVIGFRVDRGLLGVISMSSDESLIADAIADLCSSQILVQDSATTLVFYNALYQEVALHMLHDMDMPRGIELHRRVAQASADEDPNGIDSTDCAVIASHWMHVAEHSPKGSEAAISAAMKALDVLRRWAGLMRQVALAEESFTCIQCMFTMIPILGDHPEATRLHIEALLQMTFSLKLSQRKNPTFVGSEQAHLVEMTSLMTLLTREQREKLIIDQGRHCISLMQHHSFQLASLYAECIVALTPSVHEKLKFKFFTQISMLMSGDLERCRVQCEQDRQLWFDAGKPHVPTFAGDGSATFVCDLSFWPLYEIANANMTSFKLVDELLHRYQYSSHNLWQLLGMLNQFLPYRINATVTIIADTLDPLVVDVAYGKPLLRFLRLYVSAQDATTALACGVEMEELNKARPVLSGYFPCIVTYLKARQYDRVRVMLNTWEELAAKKDEWRLYSEWHRLHAQLIEDEKTPTSLPRTFIPGTQVLSVVAPLSSSDITLIRSHILSAYSLARTQHERLLACRAAVHYARLSLRFGRWADDEQLLWDALAGVSPTAHTVFEDVHEAETLLHVMRGALQQQQQQQRSRPSSHASSSSSPPTFSTATP